MGITDKHIQTATLFIVQTFVEKEKMKQNRILIKNKRKLENIKWKMKTEK
jgi:hypothetical protein